MSKEDISAEPNHFLVSALLLMKYAFDKRKLKELIAGILSIGLKHGSEEQGARLIVYGFELVELTEEEIKAVLDSLSPDIKEKVMSTYDLLIEKGIAKGAERKSYNVVANLIQQLGLDDTAAAGVAEVSVDFVRKVRADLNKKKK